VLQEVQEDTDMPIAAYFPDAEPLAPRALAAGRRRPCTHHAAADDHARSAMGRTPTPGGASFGSVTPSDGPPRPALGQVRTMTDQNGNVHTYSHDVLGRMTADAVTTLGTGVDGTVRRQEVRYNTQGQADQFTKYNAASSGSVVNQVQREFNGLGQMTVEYQ
jgi:hypothetical protein